MAIGDVILDGSGGSAGAGTSAGVGGLDRSRAVGGTGAGSYEIDLQLLTSLSFCKTLRISIVVK